METVTKTKCSCALGPRYTGSLKFTKGVISVLVCRRGLIPPMLSAAVPTVHSALGIAVTDCLSGFLALVFLKMPLTNLSSLPNTGGVLLCVRPLTHTGQRAPNCVLAAICLLTVCRSTWMHRLTHMSRNHMQCRDT